MHILIAYLIGVICFMTCLAYSNRLELRDGLWAALLWPLTVPTIALLLLCRVISGRLHYQFDVGDSPGGWGIRHPNDGWTGIAFRCPWFELQFWKRRCQDDSQS
ncbi:MAG: hypothetical protein PHN28_16040 [Aquabacterium sp.]|nr:hypothetical protein [Aquabacterium sp.]